MARIQRACYTALLSLGCASAVRSFGSGNAGQVCLNRPLEVFAHTITDASHAGVMSHFWTTGSSAQQLLANNVDMHFSYAFDGESPPSISFTAPQAAGQFFDAIRVNGTLVDGTLAATGNTTMFAAGDKVGKNAVTQGWWHQLKLPFQRSVVVTVTLVGRPSGPAPHPGVCASVYCVVRGYELPVSGPLLSVGSGYPVPPTARMVLQKRDLVAPPNAWTPLFNVSKGYEALVVGLGLGLETSPPWGTQVNGRLEVKNNYVEGCWSLLRNSTETLPGQVLGTGLEDFFDSGYGFSIIGPGVTPEPYSTDTDGEIRTCQRKDGVDTFCSVEGLPFQHPSSGVLHFSSDYTGANKAGVERFSAYRFFDHEVVGMDDGGALGWTNGCAAWNEPGTNKCGLKPMPSPPHPPFPPPGPPATTGCADGTCEAFCSLDSVRGCGVSWTGGKDMRSPRTSKPCTGGDPPHCQSPADACAEGWEVCLSDGDRPALMAALSPEECASEWGAWAMAESHAPLNASDRTFCPECSTRADYAVDNTCRPVAEPDGWGAEALCCGQGCEEPTCRTGLWPNQTLMVRAGSGVCGATASDHVTGVLCCKKSRGASARSGSGACQTSPTHVRSYVWAYVWPKK